MSVTTMPLPDQTDPEIERRIFWAVVVLYCTALVLFFTK